MDGSAPNHSPDQPRDRPQAREDKERHPDRVLSEKPAKYIQAGGLNAVWSVFLEAQFRLWADEALPLAGNIAFRTILAAFPFLIFVTSLAGWLGSVGLAEATVSFVLEMAPTEVVDPLTPQVRTVLAEARGGLVGVGLLLTLWAALGGVDSIRVALNRAYDLREHRNVLVLYLNYTLFTVISALVLLAVTFLVVLSPLSSRIMAYTLPGTPGAVHLFELLRYPVAVLILTGFLLGAHVFLPAKWRRWRDLWPGVLLTVTVWLALGIGYSYYLSNFANYSRYYGGLAGIMAALFFVYLAALALIFGGEINRAIRLRRKWRDAFADVVT
jgi:membrane protein